MCWTSASHCLQLTFGQDVSQVNQIPSRCIVEGLYIATRLCLAFLGDQAQFIGASLVNVTLYGEPFSGTLPFDQVVDESLWSSEVWWASPRLLNRDFGFCDASSQRWCAPGASKVWFPPISHTRFPACISECHPPGSSSGLLSIGGDSCMVFSREADADMRLRLLQNRKTANAPTVPHPDPMPIPTAAPVLTPEDAALCGDVKPDVDGVVAAAVLKVLELLMELDGENRDVWSQQKSRLLFVTFAQEIRFVPPVFASWDTIKIGKDDIRRQPVTYPCRNEHIRANSKFYRCKTSEIYIGFAGWNRVRSLCIGA